MCRPFSLSDLDRDLSREMVEVASPIAKAPQKVPQSLTKSAAAAMASAKARRKAAISADDGDDGDPVLGECTKCLIEVRESQYTGGWADKMSGGRFKCSDLDACAKHLAETNAILIADTGRPTRQLKK